MVGTDKFLDLLRQSSLVESDVLEKALTDIGPTAESETPDGGSALADKLVEAKLITSWQRSKLLEGRHKGFFLGRYKLLGLLGTGGMSSVYLAEHTRMHHRVALKVLPQSRVNDSSYLARFQREAQAAARLDHKNIVRAYDIDNEGNIHYLVMEYVEGRDLQSMINDDGPMEFDTIAEYIRQAAEGLEHAHNAGLIHRDIKPANLLVDQKGVVKVLDMGLARWEQDDKLASLTIAHEENVLGTADYLAPEQAKDSHSVDKRADIYSLGCTMYFLLVGHPPFPDGTLAQRIWKHQNQMPKSVYEERPDSPPPLVDVCLRMMSKQPEARYQSAGEVAQVLAKWLEMRGKPAATGSARLMGSRHQRRSTTSPKAPPRRSEKPGSDDTISNLNRETIAANESDKAHPGASSKPGGSDLKLSDSSIVGRSNVLSGPGQSGRGSSKGPGSGSAKPLFVAKPLEAPPKKDETLTNLIDDALKEIESHPRPSKKGGSPKSSGGHPFGRQPTLPKWFWLVLGGMVLFAVVVGLLLKL